MPSGETSCRVGVEESGLAAGLGPLVVTAAVLADDTPAGQRWVGRRPRAKLSLDLGDSERLLSHSNFTLGEAGARVLSADRFRDPQALFEQLSLEGPSRWRACFSGCGGKARATYWPLVARCGG